MRSEVTAREDTTMPFGILVLWLLSFIRIACLFALMIAAHLAFLECIKGPGPPPSCPYYSHYLAAVGFFDIAVLALLRRPGHRRLLLASAFDVFLCAIGTLVVVGGLWHFSSLLHFYASAICLISIAHFAIFLVPVVREYYRKRTDLTSVSQK